MTRPRFSVIVPTRDRPRSLERCLASLAALRPPPGGYEVLVVDDGSRRPPAGLVESLPPRLEARLIRQDASGPARARNRGAAEARGEVLAFTDDDCTADPGWLEAFAARGATGATGDGGGFGGRTVNRIASSPYATASQLLIDYLFSYYNQVPGRVPLFVSNNLVLPRSIFERLGGFDESFRRAGGEDRELCDRWTREGHRLSFAPEAVIHHHHDLTLAGYLRQQFNYGRGARRFHELRARAGLGRPPVEPWSFYRDLLLHPYRSGGSGRLRLSTLLVLSQMANVAGYASLAIGREGEPAQPRRTSRL